VAAFVDTNILLYALSSANAGEVVKVARATQLVTELTSKREMILSGQVLSEFSAVASRKGSRPLSWEQIGTAVRELSKNLVIAVDASLVNLALQRVQTSRISYWDALIVEAALRANASILYTEDMHHGTRYGGLEVCNPFLP
jgi:predicted nucleic acid-binding protein